MKIKTFSWLTIILLILTKPILSASVNTSSKNSENIKPQNFCNGEIKNSMMLGENNTREEEITTNVEQPNNTTVEPYLIKVEESTTSPMMMFRRGHGVGDRGVERRNEAAEAASGEDKRRRVDGRGDDEKNSYQVPRGTVATWLAEGAAEMEDSLPFSMEEAKAIEIQFKDAITAYHDAPRLIVQEGEIVPPDPNITSNNKDSENHEIMRLLKNVITICYSSDVANSIDALTPMAFVRAKDLSAAKINEIFDELDTTKNVCQHFNRVDLIPRLRGGMMAAGGGAAVMPALVNVNIPPHLLPINVANLAAITEHYTELAENYPAHNDNINRIINALNDYEGTVATQGINLVVSAIGRTNAHINGDLFLAQRWEDARVRTSQLINRNNNIIHLYVAAIANDGAIAAQKNRMRIDIVVARCFFEAAQAVEAGALPAVVNAWDAAANAANFPMQGVNLPQAHLVPPQVTPEDAAEQTLQNAIAAGVVGIAIPNPW